MCHLKSRCFWDSIYHKSFAKSLLDNIEIVSKHVNGISSCHGELTAYLFSECFFNEHFGKEHSTAVPYNCLWLTHARSSYSGPLWLPTDLLFSFFLLLSDLVFPHKCRTCSVKSDSECQLFSVKMLHGWFWTLCLALPWLFYKNWMSEINEPSTLDSAFL